MKFIQILIVLFIFQNRLLFAQLNESDSIPWQVRLTSTASVLDGNVARTLLLNKFEVAHSNSKWGISLRNDYQYGTTRYINTESDLISYNFLYLTPFKKLYPFVMGLIETNLRRNIVFRSQIGIGVTWNAVFEKRNILKFSLTGTFEETQYGKNIFDDQLYNGSSIIDTWRITGRLYGKNTLIKDKLKIIYEFWWQQSVEYENNYRFHSEDVLELPISKKFAFRAGFRYSYENIELLGLKPFDLFLTYGLTITNF